MARPIKETPELRGDDAVRFETIISTPKPVSKEEKERAKKAYELMKSISSSQWWKLISVYFDLKNFISWDWLPHNNFMWSGVALQKPP